MSGAPHGASRPSPGLPEDGDRPTAMLRLMDRGTDLVESLVSGLTDDDLRRPCRLPGWTRGHLVTHLANNADALVNLTRWAATGEERPMYASRQQRDADIAAGADRPLGEQLTDLRRADAGLATALRMLGGPSWSAPVRDGQGGPITGRDIPFLRVRELWVHAVDLDAGTDFADLPAEVLQPLLADLAATMGRQPDGPSLVLAPDDGSGPWEFGGGADRVTVRGPAGSMVGWLVGRLDPAGLRADGEFPAVPRWL